MPEPLLGPLASAGGWLLTYLLHSTVLIAGAWLLTRALSARPATREMVWRMALLGGLLTATGVELSGPERGAVDMLALGPRRVLAESGEVRSGGVRRMRVRTMALAVEERSSRNQAAFGALVRGPLSSLLALLWAVGAVGWLGALACSRRALAEIEATLGEPGRRARAALEAMRGGRVVALYGSEAISAPCVLPGRRIALPVRCETEMSDAELRAVVAHELAHVDRRDVAWSGALRVVTGILWLQPLNRVALRGALGAAEEICDDRALARTGERVGLATSISRVAEWAVGSAPDPVPASIASRRAGPVSARVRRILTGSRRTERRWHGVVAAALVTAPVAWLPAVAAPTPRLTAVFVEERAVVAPVPGHATGESAAPAPRRDPAEWSGPWYRTDVRIRITRVVGP